MRLVEIDARAEAAGLFVSQSLADARALVPGLVVREIDRAFLATIFCDFADWHSNASPLVAVLGEPGGYGDLALDIAGTAHLFGGEQAMLDRLCGRLSALGYSVAAGIADTIGAAWALAHFLPGHVLQGEPREVLAPLPVAALRLDPARIEGLTQLGLRRIGDLYGRDRRALAARFGASLLLRLDQALGEIEERLTPRLPLTDFHAERRFPEPIGLIDDVLRTAHDLALRLATDLERAGQGAQAFHLFLYRVDHQLLTLTVKAGRPTRDAAHIGRLFAHRAERLGGEYDAGFGIDMIRLMADRTSPLAPAQMGAFATPDAGADLDRLLDRLSSRLGGGTVLRLTFANTHLPERAAGFEPALSPGRADPLASPDPSLPRPLRLLPHPEPVEPLMPEVPDGPPAGMVWRQRRYRFLRARGPERLAPEWWRHAAPPPLTRKPVEDRTDIDREGEPKVKPVEAALATLAPAGLDWRDGGGPAQEKPLLPAASGEAGPMVPSVFDADALTRDYFVVEDELGHRFWLFRQGFYRQDATPRWFLHGFFA